MANWDKVRQKNSVGPALGMAMNKAIDLVIALNQKNMSKLPLNELKKAVLDTRDWIYEENEKKQQEVLSSLLEEETTKELPPEKDLFK